MSLTEPRLRAALDAAMIQITSTVMPVAERLPDGLDLTAQSSARRVERDLLEASQLDLRRNMSAFRLVFATELRAKVAQELSPRPDPRRTLATTDWQSLSLVENSEMEERMLSDRIAQSISHACESESREFASYMGSLMPDGGADADHHPLRAETIAGALYVAIEAVSEQADTRKLLARELGRAVAKAMPACYTQIVAELRARGVQPIALTVRTVEGPGNLLPGVTSGYASLSGLRSQHSDPVTHSFAGSDAGSDTDGGTGLRSRRSATTSPGGPTTTPGMRSLDSRFDPPSARPDAHLMALLRRLSAVAVPAPFEGETHRPGRGDLAASGPASGPGAMAFTTAADAARAAGETAYPVDALTGLMAVNLIRAHREELLQASGGRIDHMVIDVVGGLFDQILSDSRVPPHLARQIARLQLPVLRVALRDASFFSSRRHPVRRFVNRIASLACAFDDFDVDPGRQFLIRVGELVQQIVDGDFDQVALYTAKLEALEVFISEQAVSATPQQAAVTTLHRKESELRLQQRYTLQLHGALSALPLAPCVRDFLPEIWSQALVLASTRDGPASDRAQRYRRVARDLVMSVQPKGSTALRKGFLMRLPALMKDLNEGLLLIGWPEFAQREFFARLLPAQAESLKAQPLSELDHNMMVKQLEAVFNIPVPGTESLSPADAVPDVDAETIARRFSADEAAHVGLVLEGAIDWSGDVDGDIDLGAGTPAETEPGAPADDSSSVGLGLGMDLALDLNLDLTHPEPPEPTHGPQLMDHIHLGFAYQMLLRNEWHKVRLAHVSAGRSFFVFTRGRQHQETISMTARMVARMCETGRMRAVESTYLMERATLRARKQLAVLSESTRH